MNSKKNKKRLLIVRVFSCICVLIYQLIHIYAVFQSEIEGNVNFQNGVWKIVVNGTEVSKGVEKKFTISNMQIESDENVKSNKLSPRTYRIFYNFYKP